MLACKTEVKGVAYFSASRSEIVTAEGCSVGIKQEVLSLCRRKRRYLTPETRFPDGNMMLNSTSRTQPRKVMLETGKVSREDVMEKEKKVLF